jgi:SpoVK/Ycf46/Vps4 family AAA+-type ATPase
MEELFKEAMRIEAERPERARELYKTGLKDLRQMYLDHPQTRALTGELIQQYYRRLEALTTTPSQQQIKEESVIVTDSPQVFWKDIVGLDDVIETIQATIMLPIRHQETINAELFNGLLLYGPPGTGKTLLAKAIATESRFVSCREAQRFPPPE